MLGARRSLRQGFLPRTLQVVADDKGAEAERLRVFWVRSYKRRDGRSVVRPKSHGESRDRWPMGLDERKNFVHNFLPPQAPVEPAPATFLSTKTTTSFQVG